MSGENPRPPRMTDSQINRLSRTIVQKLNSNVCSRCNTRLAALSFDGTFSLYCGQCTTNALSLCQICNRRPVSENGTCSSQSCIIISRHLRSRRLNRKKTTTPVPPTPDKACILCKTNLARKDGFCSSQCIENSQKQAPCILQIPKGHHLYKNVHDQFIQSWRHPTSPPIVEYIYKIINTKIIRDKYEAYRHSVENKGHFADRSMQPGNERRRWHGTTRTCAIGNAGNATLCKSSACSLCRIISNSFLLAHAKSHGRSLQRFGKGIYTSSTSSKSDSYSKNPSYSYSKAVLLNRVVVGRGKILFNDDTSLTEPPAGYDSVIGQKGERLNYDELTVYREDAIIPAYLVIYVDI